MSYYGRGDLDPTDFGTGWRAAVAWRLYSMIPSTVRKVVDVEIKGLRLWTKWRRRKEAERWATTAQGASAWSPLIASGPALTSRRRRTRRRRRMM